MRELRTGAETGGDADILVVLSGHEALDELTLEALRGVASPLRTASEPDLGTVEGTGIRLLVFDAAHPRLSIDVFVRQAAERVPAADLLALLPPGTEPPAAIDRWLARPFQADTLAALARSLLERHGATRDSERTGPALQLRRPARFSARPLYAEAERYVRESLERARTAGEPPAMPTAGVVAEKLHTSLLQSNLLLLRALEPYDRFELPTHCANVAIFAAKIAMGLDLSLSETLRVVQAGLLHDIGMMRLPDRILRKEGPLSEAERAEMQRHPLYGAELARALGPDYAWLERAVAQEHERHGGQGYPEGLAGDAIDPIARILGVADVFEAFSHARSYRSPFTSYEALEKITALRGDHFAPEVVDALTDEIAVFPLDSYVLLNTGEIGRVVAGNPENLMRPAIEVLWDDGWNALSKPRRLELGKEPQLSISRPLNEAEVPIT